MDNFTSAACGFLGGLIVGALFLADASMSSTIKDCEITGKIRIGEKLFECHPVGKTDDNER